MSQELSNSEQVAEFENDTWSRCSAIYVDGFGALVSEAIAPLLEEVRVSADDRVLDVGTGPGLVAAEVAKRGAKALGIDFSEAMIAEAKQLHPEVEFKEASAEALPFDDESFDCVAGNFVLHHLGQPDVAMSEAYRVLRKGGRVGFTIWADPTKLEAFGLFFAAIEEHVGTPDLPHGPLFGVSDFDVFHGLVRDAGFSDSAVRELPIAWQTPTIESYLTAFRSWGNLSEFPEDVREKIEATVRENAEVYRKGDRLIMPNPALMISGVK